MLSLDVRRLSVQRSFWSGGARIFDLFGLLYDHEWTAPDPEAAFNKSDQQALADDWKAVFDDLATVWKVMKPELPSERASTL